MAYVWRVEDGNVSRRTGLERTQLRTRQRQSSTSGDASHGLGDRQSEIEAGERYHQRQVLRHGRAGVEVRGDRQRGTGVRERATGRVMSELQEEGRSRQERRHGRRRGQSRDPADVQGYQVVGADRPPRRTPQLRAARRSELLGVDLEPESQICGARQDLVRLGQRERSLLAEHVTEPGQPFRRHGRQHLVDDEPHVGASVAGRTQGVRRARRGTWERAAEEASSRERRRIARRLLSSSSTVRPYPDFTSTVVTPNRANSARRGRVIATSSSSLRERRSPTLNRIPPPSRGDLLIGRAGQPPLELELTGRAEERVGVRVDEAGKATQPAPSNVRGPRDRRGGALPPAGGPPSLRSPRLRRRGSRRRRSRGYRADPWVRPAGQPAAQGRGRAARHPCDDRCLQGAVTPRSSEFARPARGPSSRAPLVPGVRVACDAQSRGHS